MFKYFFLIFVFLYHTRGHAVPENIIQSLPSLFKNFPLMLENATDPADNSSDPDGCNKVIVKINGQNNINAGVQVAIINIETTIVAKVNTDGYLVTPGIGAHKLHINSLAWNDARQACIEEGGHLAVINSDAEEAILLRMLRGNGTNAAWLGLHDFYKQDDWVTVTDQILKNTGYTKWATKHVDEADSDVNRQNCAALIAEGGMDKKLCDILSPFFCEISV